MLQFDHHKMEDAKKRHCEAILSMLDTDDMNYLNDQLSKVFGHLSPVPTFVDILAANPEKLEHYRSEFDKRDKTKFFVPPPPKGSEPKDRKSFLALYDKLSKTGRYQNQSLKYSEKDKLGNTNYHNYNTHVMLRAFELQTCPYCNRNFILLIDKDDGTTAMTCDIDHWIPKKEYPVFAVSFYNLIPACKLCNFLKSDHKELHASPYETNLDITNTLKFGIEITNSRFPRSPDSMEIILLQSPSLNLIPGAAKKVQEFVKAFRMHEQYEKHTDIAQEVILKYLLHDKSYLDEQYRRYGGLLFTHRDDVDRLYFGRYNGVENYHKRPMSKFAHDIEDHLNGKTDFMSLVTRDKATALKLEMERLGIGKRLKILLQRICLRR